MPEAGEQTIDWSNPDAPVAGTVGQLKKLIDDEAQKIADQTVAKTAVPSIYSGINFVGKAANDDVTPGRIFTKYAMALAIGGNDQSKALQHAEAMYKHSRHIADEAVVKALSLTSFTGGGAIVPEEMAEDIVQLIYPQSVIRNLGAEQLPLINGQLTLPAENAAMTAQYIGENKKAPVDQPEYGNLKLTQRKLALLCPVSNDLLRTRVSAKVEESIMRNIQNAFSAAENIHFIRGNGTENAPKGIRYQTDASQIYAANGTVNVANVTNDCTKAISLVEEALESTMISCAWLMTTRSKMWLMAQRDDTGRYIWRDEIKSGSFEGFPLKVVNQIPKNLGGGSNESEVYFGDFSRLTIGDSMQMVFDADPRAAYHNGTEMISAYQQDQTVFRSIAGHDILLRYPKAFSIMTGVTWGA